MSTTNKQQASGLYKPLMQKHDGTIHDNYMLDRYEGTGILGTWTKEDEANFNMNMADAEWLRNLELMDYQNWYNSPEQQALRMRQAGLNPDLQGVNGSIPSSSASAPKPTAPAGSNPLDTGVQLAGAFLQTISVGHKLAESVTKVIGGNIANQASRVTDIFKNMNSFLGQIVPAGVPVLDAEGNLSESTHQIMSIDHLKAFDELFPRGKSRKMAHKFLQAFQDSDYHKNLWYGLRGTTEEKRKNLLSWLGSSQYKALDVVLMDSLGKVYDIVRQADIAVGQERISTAKYTKAFYDSKDAEAAAAREDWSNLRFKEFENIRKKSINAVNKLLFPLEDSHPVLFNIASAVAPVLIDYFLGLSFAPLNR